MVRVVYISECDRVPVLNPEPNITGVEDFVIHTQDALLTLNSAVDREVTDSYRLSIRVVDRVTLQTGTIAIKVTYSGKSLKYDH